jgi:ferrous iron transport protein B
MAAISGVLVPVMRPLGLGDWRIVTSLISGFMAKESVVSVMRVLFKSAGGVQAVMSTTAAAGLLIFCLLYTPCVAAVASVKREMGKLWAAGLIIWQCVIAWVAVFLIRFIVSLF